MNLDQFFLCTELLIAVAVACQTVELLILKKEYGPGGLWDWQLLRNELPHWGGIFRPRPFMASLILRLGLAILLPCVHYWLIPTLLMLGTLIIAMRWRGTYNGGSDSMFFLVLFGLSAARLLDKSPLVLVGVGYIAVQCCLSYFLAGLAKLRNSTWRSGQAFSQLLLSPAYILPVQTRYLSRYHGLCFGFSWCTILFELSSPLIFLMGENFCLIFVVIAMCFHLANVYLLGLNHFFWGWLAAYPSLFLVSRHLSF